MATDAPATSRFAEKRELILDGAARAFNLHGIKGATLASIAASVGLATNSLTYYYRKKEALAAACLLRSMAAVEAHAAAAAAQSAGTAARLQHFLSGYVGMLAAIAEGRHPEMIVFNDVRALTPPHAADVFNAYTGMFRRVRSLLQGPETAGLGRDALNARAHLLLSLTTWTRAWVFRYETGDYAEVAGRIADLLTHGLAAPGQGWHAAASAALPELALPTGADRQDTPQAAAMTRHPLRGPQPPGSGPSLTQEAYLRAATRLINEHGYRGASVDRIAAELRLTKGSFYHHHDTKDALVSACFDRTFAAVRAAQDLAGALPGSGWQRLVQACRLLVRHQMSARGPLLRVSAWSALPEPMRREMLRTMSRLGERFGRVILEGMADGTVRVVDPSIAAQLVSGMVNAAAELERWVPVAAEAGADALAAELFARPLLEGLLAPA
jgi:AcrR family transcriptional regulator